MNENLKALYVCITNNEVVIFETNLKSFVELVNENIKGSRNYQWYYRSFKESKHFAVVINDKEYFFQELL